MLRTFLFDTSRDDTPGGFPWRRSLWMVSRDARSLWRFRSTELRTQLRLWSTLAGGREPRTQSLKALWPRGNKSSPAFHRTNTYDEGSRRELSGESTSFSPDILPNILNKNKYPMKPTYKQIQDLLRQVHKDSESVTRISQFVSTEESVIQFLTESQPNELWAFIFEGSTEGAQRYINRIRTFLSRTRAEFRADGKRVYKFSIIQGLRYLNAFETAVVLVRHTPDKDWKKTRAFIEAHLVVEDEETSEKSSVN